MRRVVDVWRLELAGIEAEAHLKDVVVGRGRIHGVDLRRVRSLAVANVGWVADALEANAEGGLLRISQPHAHGQLGFDAEQLVGEYL